MLQSEEHFFRSFINGNAECPVRRVEFPSRRYVAPGSAIEDDQRIHRIVVDCVDVAGFGINIQAALKLDLGIQPGNDPLWLGQRGGGGSTRRSIVDENLKQVLVSHHDFVVDGIDCNGTECRVRVVNPSDWLQLRAVLRGSAPGRWGSRARILPLLQCRHENLFSAGLTAGRNRLAYLSTCLGKRFYRNEPFLPEHFRLWNSVLNQTTFPRQ